MTTYNLIQNYKTLIFTQHTICKDTSKALQTAWDMCMDMGRLHGFSTDRCHECWCKAIQDYECEERK